MSEHCCSVSTAPQESADPRYRRILWIALILNAVMFLTEIIAGSAAGSLSLFADALDFFGDACNYAVGLYLISRPLRLRAKFSLAKAAVMAGFGVIILLTALSRIFHHTPPSYEAMGIIGVLALFTNVSVAFLLFSHKGGDSNRRSIWLCTRNDAIGNVLVMLAAVGVYYTGSAIPDLLVAGIMASLGLSAAWQVTKHARQELNGVVDDKAVSSFHQH